MKNCKICGNKENNKTFFAHEMMFGSREKFEYIKCGKCGCLQIKIIPNNLAEYYPQNYNAYDKVTKINDSILKHFLKNQRMKYCLYGEKIFIGMAMSAIYGCNFLPKLKRAKVQKHDKILDIGTGNGRRLVSLRKEGLTNLIGIDPFIESDIYYDNGVRVLKKEIFEVSEKFDFIMLNHSFEHMQNPFEVLEHLYKILKPGKYIMIRTPVVDSYSWKKYLGNWVALDAPRHLFIYNEKSIKFVAEQTGFILVDILFDSTDYQFWGSEQYVRDIPMRDHRSYYENPENSIFSKHQIKRFKKHASKLNKNKEGDAACFYLQKPKKI